MAKETTRNSSSTTWTKSSFAVLLELKPALHKVFFNVPAKTGILVMSRKFATAIMEENNANDAKAKELFQNWLYLAFSYSPGDSETGGDSAKAKEEVKVEKRHRAFYEMYRELTKPDLEAATKVLNKARAWFGLWEFESDHPSLVIPEFPPLTSNSDVQSASTVQGLGSPATNITSSNEEPAGPSKHPKHHVQLAPDRNETQQSQTPETANHPTRSKKARRSLPANKTKKSQRKTRTSLPPPLDLTSVALRAAGLEGSSDLTPEAEIDQIHNDALGKQPTPKGAEVTTVEPNDSNEPIHPMVEPKSKTSKKKRKSTKSSQRSRGPRASVRVAAARGSEPGTDFELQTEQQLETDPQPPVDYHNLAPTNQAEASAPTFPLKVGEESRNDMETESEYDTQDHPAAVPPRSFPAIHGLGLDERGEMEVDDEPTGSRVKSDLLPAATQLDAYTKTGASSLINGGSLSVRRGPTNNVDPLASDETDIESDDTPSGHWDNAWLEEYVRIPVWAKSRQELCELPYFKSMQGGVYTRGNTVYGYLLGRFPSPRDAWCHEGRLIISHGGGKNVLDDSDSKNNPALPNKSRHQLGDDQLESDLSVKALLTAYRMFRPVVVLAEADYEHLQGFNLKQGYARGASYYVLGHYAIVAAWAEKEEVGNQGNSSVHTRWKFAFQYIESDQGPPWWIQSPSTPIPQPKPPFEERVPQTVEERRAFGREVIPTRLNVSEITVGSFPNVTLLKCEHCVTFSPPVYRGRICLNPDCSLFWLDANRQPVSQDKLEFNPEFLVLRELPEQLKNIPYPIVPEYPEWQRRRSGESIFNRQFWVGACCHRCGRVSCRQRWQYWRCLTCGLRRNDSSPQIYPSSSLDSPLSCESQGDGNFNPYDLETECRVIQYPKGEHRLVIYYKLPRDAGQIVHVLNNSSATEIADQLFELYQQDACATNMFQRHAIKTHGVKGELYAQHFSHNAGAPYKYIAEAVSTPFDKCPTSVCQAREHIHYLCKSALDKSTDFNEILSVAYAEGQEMNFHSDDEPGLGPVVAGLTLGSHAEMLFRHHVAYKKNFLYKNGPFRPSEARVPEASSDRILQITLSHGDLLIMDGLNIQKQYEHAVFVRDNDLVRFAATARFIHPQPLPATNLTHVKPSLQPPETAASWQKPMNTVGFVNVRQQTRLPRMESHQRKPRFTN